MVGGRGTCWGGDGRGLGVRGMSGWGRSEWVEKRDLSVWVNGLFEGGRRGRGGRGGEGMDFSKT